MCVGRENYTRCFCSKGKTLATYRGQMTKIVKDPRIRPLERFIVEEIHYKDGVVTIKFIACDECVGVYENLFYSHPDGWIKGKYPENFEEIDRN